MKKAFRFARMFGGFATGWGLADYIFNHPSIATPWILAVGLVVSIIGFLEP